MEKQTSVSQFICWGNCQPDAHFFLSDYIKQAFLLDSFLFLFYCVNNTFICSKGSRRLVFFSCYTFRWIGIQNSFSFASLNPLFALRHHQDWQFFFYNKPFPLSFSAVHYALPVTVHNGTSAFHSSHGFDHYFLSFGEIHLIIHTIR